MLMRCVIFLMVLLVSSGCAKVVGTTVGAAATVGKTAVKTSVNVSGDIVEAAVTDGNAKTEHHDDDPRPFNASRNAMQDVDIALTRASISRRNVLLVLGGNWCHDSRGLAAKFARTELAETIADGYELVWVDVGYRDRNLDVAARFGVMQLLGTPTVLIVSPEGALLNADSVHDWRTADSKPYDETLAYFQRYAARGGI